MKSFIKSVLLFSVFASLFYGFAILVTGRILPNSFHGNLLTENKIVARDGSKRRFVSAQNSETVDIVVLGSSHAYRGYDGRIFHDAKFSSYNLGSSGQRLLLTEFIYRKYLSKLKPEK